MCSGFQSFCLSVQELNSMEGEINFPYLLAEMLAILIINSPDCVYCGTDTTNKGI